MYDAFRFLPTFLFYKKLHLVGQVRRQSLPLKLGYVTRVFPLRALQVVARPSKGEVEDFNFLGDLNLGSALDL